MLDLPAIYVSATRKSSGKTMISTGLASAISSRGIKIQTFKKGPDYIDPMWMARASGSACYNLDFHTQSHDEICDLFRKKSKLSEYSLVEGNKGLFDGVDLHGADSNAAMSGLLGVPIVLVIDASGITRGVAPLVNGYIDFDDGIDIAGVVLNNVAGSRHESKLRQVLEHYTDINVWGAVQKAPELTIDERHLGLVTDVELESSDRKIRLIRNAIEQQVDVNKVLESVSRKPIDPTEKKRRGPVIDCSSRVSKMSGLRIGVAKDTAFSFYYPDDLEALIANGTEILYFDTIRDQHLPEVDALLIGGGFPETSAAALSQNRAMHDAIRQFVDSGKPVYAECGGLMYLGRSIRWGNQKYPMIGCLPVDAEMETRPVGRGYVQLAPTVYHPWFSETKSDFPAASMSLAAHEFHYSRLTNIDSAVNFAYEVKRGYGVDGKNDGLIYGNILASYAHLRHTAQTPWVHWFLKCIEGTFSRAA